MIPIYEPWESGFSETLNALRGLQLSHGTAKQIASSMLKRLSMGVNVLLTCNGTASNHLMLEAIKFKHPNVRRLIFPNNVYVAAWNPAAEDHRFLCETVDANLDTWNADYSKVIAGEGTAFVIVHNIGQVVNVPAMMERFPGAVFIEDNCEGFLGKYMHLPTGSVSLCSSLSFFGNKTVTCGEGGAFLTPDDAVFEYISRVYSQGQTSTRYVHDMVAYNYRMSNLNAAMLVDQLRELHLIKSMKARLFEKYRRAFSDLPVVFPKDEPDTESSRWMFGLRIPGLRSYREIGDFLTKRNIESRPMFYPITAHKHLTNRFVVDRVVVADQLNRECVLLPSFPGITEEQSNTVIKAVREFFI